jgi:DNA polymerase-3 subunit delta'
VIPMGHSTGFIPFSQIIGQERAVGFLKQVILQERVPHGYLFVGTPGTGRTSTAVALAQSVNCAKPVNGEACGECRSCRLAASGKSQDLEIIMPDRGSIRIEQIRDLEHEIALKPFGKYRVVLIPRAELMTDEASNAFLKTLEEPPHGNMLILTVTDPKHLLPTIVSRCQQVVFRPIPAHLIAEWLVEQKKMDGAKARLLAKISEGSLGKAVEMCDDDFLGKREGYLSGLMNLPGIPEDEILQLALEYTGKGKKKPEGELEKGGEGVSDLLSVWRMWFRDLVLVKAKGAEDLLINTDFSDELKKISKVSNIDDLIEGLQLLDQAERDLFRSRNLDLMMENVLLRLRRLTGYMKASAPSGQRVPHE